MWGGESRQRSDRGLTGQDSSYGCGRDRAVEQGSRSVSVEQGYRVDKGQDWKAKAESGQHSSYEGASYDRIRVCLGQNWKAEPRQGATWQSLTMVKLLQPW